MRQRATQQAPGDKEAPRLEGMEVLFDERVSLFPVDVGERSESDTARGPGRSRDGGREGD